MVSNILHKADSRGEANHGWLQSRHSFSFANYYNPERMHFGALRVFNDDTVAAGMGFGTHRHDNMEIVSIPLEGNLEHRDSMGNVAVIQHGDIQVMSAGTGIAHSEYNQSKEVPVKFLQIWVIPHTRNVEPRYGQITLNPADRHNRLQQIISPHPDDAGLWIHQNAWFSLGRFDAGTTVNYDVHDKGQGVYVFVLHGEVAVNGQPLQTRDALGLTDTDTVAVTAASDAEVLVIEVPMVV